MVTRNGRWVVMLNEGGAVQIVKEPAEGSTTAYSIWCSYNDLMHLRKLLEPLPGVGIVVTTASLTRECP